MYYFILVSQLWILWIYYFYLHAMIVNMIKYGCFHCTSDPSLTLTFSLKTFVQRETCMCIVCRAVKIPESNLPKTCCGFVDVLVCGCIIVWRLYHLPNKVCFCIFWVLLRCCILVHVNVSFAYIYMYFFSKGYGILRKNFLGKSRCNLCEFQTKHHWQCTLGLVILVLTTLGSTLLRKSLIQQHWRRRINVMNDFYYF